MKTADHTPVVVAASREELEKALEALIQRLQNGSIDKKGSLEFVCYTGNSTHYLLEVKCIPF